MFDSPYSLLIRKRSATRDWNMGLRLVLKAHLGALPETTWYGLICYWDAEREIEEVKRNEWRMQAGKGGHGPLLDFW
jgi:hypothetical protein